MQYVTHQFAHLDALNRARRWLVQLGFDPCHIETHTDGIPRIAVMGRPGELAEAELVIAAAERADPQGWPSFWDLARQEHILPGTVESVTVIGQDPRPRAEIHWLPLGDDRAAAPSGAEIEWLVERFG